MHGTDLGVNKKSLTICYSMVDNGKDDVDNLTYLDHNAVTIHSFLGFTDPPLHNITIVSGQVL